MNNYSVIWSANIINGKIDGQAKIEGQTFSDARNKFIQKYSIEWGIEIISCAEVEVNIKNDIWNPTIFDLFKVPLILEAKGIAKFVSIFNQQ